MKRIVIALMIIFFSFCYGGEVLAAGYKPPSAICFNLQGGTEILTLTIKAMGKVTMADGSTQFYAINGVFFDPSDGFSMPLAGTGYMSSGQYNRIFNFDVTASGFYQTQRVINYLGDWDVVEGSGELVYSGYTAEGFFYQGIFSITAVDCKAQTIPPVLGLPLLQ